MLDYQRVQLEGVDVVVKPEAATAADLSLKSDPRPSIWRPRLHPLQPQYSASSRTSRPNQRHQGGRAGTTTDLTIQIRR